MDLEVVGQGDVMLWISGGCHVMDRRWRQKTLTGFRLRMLQGRRQWQFLLDLLGMFKSQIRSLYI